jgi:Family of unknown function (DUF6476)
MATSDGSHGPKAEDSDLDTALPGASPFTPRQINILRLMVGIMGLTLVGGLALVVFALVWRLNKLPAASQAIANAGATLADVRKFAAATPELRYGEARLPKGAKVVASHMQGDQLVLVLEDSAGSSVVAFDTKLWKMTGLARLDASQ